jgi:hypothetical protein
MMFKAKENKERAALQAAIELHEQAIRDMQSKADQLKAELDALNWAKIKKFQEAEAQDARSTLLVNGAPVLPQAGIVFINELPTREEERLRDDLTFAMSEVLRLQNKTNGLRRLYEVKFNSG